ncbi:MAG: hypothetical protein ACOY0T_35605 [Myxococcota bacterium]
MSTFICSNRHISALAAYAIAHDLHTPVPYTAAEAEMPPAELLALRLYEKNLDAFRAYYRGRHLDEVHPFEFDCEGSSLHRTLTPIELIKAAKCYAYQASDAPDWNGCVIAELVDSIVNRLITALPGYDRAAREL